MRTEVMTAFARLRDGLERLGLSILIPAYGIERGALAVAAVAIGAGLLTFVTLPAEPARLSRFAIEHVQLFGMEDSTPLRMAFLTYFVTLLAGALILRFLAFPQRAAPARTLHPQLIGVAGVVLIALALAYGAKSVLPRAGEPRWLYALYFAYGGFIAVLVWYRKLPAPAVTFAVVLVLMAACWPTTIGLMSRVSVPLLPMVDQHLSALFSGGQMLEFGYRLFVDIPAGYGTLTPLALAAAIQAGMTINVAHLIYLVEAFQVTTLCLFILATLALTYQAESRSRAAAILLVVLVASPFLSFGNKGVLFPNQSGFRFVMFPAAVLVITFVRGRSIAAGAALSGAVAMLALLHNVETGIAIVAGLGLAWLLRAHTERPFDIALAVAIGLVSAATVVGFAILAHRAVLGIWPIASFQQGTGVLQSFGAGFGGFHPPFRVVVFVIFCHCGYVLVRAIASLLGRKGDQPDVASAGLSAMLIAWAPYYANRAIDWNFWTYVTLYALLLAPVIAKSTARAGWLALASLLLLFPIPLTTAHDDLIGLAASAAMRVDEHCVAGLSLTPEACGEHQARAKELVRLARPGDVLWITAYPFLTLQLTGLRPLVAPLDLYAAALDEADLGGVAGRIRLARPTALLLDGTEASLVNDAIPAPMRSLLQRIAASAGYKPCSLIDLSNWQAWLQEKDCQETSTLVNTMRARAAGP